MSDELRVRVRCNLPGQNLCSARVKRKIELNFAPSCSHPRGCASEEIIRYKSIIATKQQRGINMNAWRLN